MGKLTKAELRAQLEAALANYKGPVTHCPPGTPPNEDAEQRGQRTFDRALREIAQLSGSRRADNLQAIEARRIALPTLSVSAGEDYLRRILTCRCVFPPRRVRVRPCWRDGQ